jgi:hypothetical protein
LCELLWDVPNDPRGELRWCLSKLRSVFDGPGRRRVDTPGDSVRLDLSDCLVDAVEVACAAQQGIETLAPDRLRALCALFKGEFLDGLEIDRNPSFNGWLTAQRRRFRGCHTALLEHLAATPRRAVRLLEKWLELAPLIRVHEPAHRTGPAWADLRRREHLARRRACSTPKGLITRLSVRLGGGQGAAEGLARAQPPPCPADTFRRRGRACRNAASGPSRGPSR